MLSPNERTVIIPVYNAAAYVAERGCGDSGWIRAVLLGV